VAEVTANEVTALTTPATLFIAAIHVLLNARVVVQRVTLLHGQQHQHGLHWSAKHEARPADMF